MYGIIKSESLLCMGSNSLNKLPKKELEFKMVPNISNVERKRLNEEGFNVFAHKKKMVNYLREALFKKWTDV